MKKTLVDGPLGFHLPEDQARHLETLLKSLPKDKAYQYRKKNTVAEAVFEPGERASVDIVTTDSVDKDAEVVLPGGIDLESYRKNSIVLFDHDRAKPIGKSLWIKSTNNGMKSKTLYASRPEDYQGDFLPDLVFALVQQDILKGRSIGFLPVEIDAPTQAQKEARPDWERANAIISKSVLFEYSVVAVPCNEDALQEIVSKSIQGISVKSLQALGLKVSGVALAKTVKPIDEGQLLVKLLERIKLDPDKIAEQVIEMIQSRGRV